MKLQPGELVQKMEMGLVPPKPIAFLALSTCGKAWLELRPVAAEELLDLDEKLRDLLRARPAYWSGQPFSPEFMVWPRPDKAYELRWDI